MRSLLVFVVPALLSFSLLACASDDGPAEPPHDVITNPLVQEGGDCTKNEDCASDLCELRVATSVTTKGKPAPCDACGDGEPTPAPAPAPPPAPGPAPAPQPTPAPVTGICATR